MYQILRQILKTGIKTETPPAPDYSLRAGGHQQLREEILRHIGRALAIRHVDAGSCNGCELEIHALNNAYYNIEGLGIKFVASPRHADMLLVTGPVSRHMETALKRTYDAMPEPKLVVAVGDCGCNGGIYSSADSPGGGNYARCGKISSVIPVDVAIPGCPPTPVMLLQGILAAVSASNKSGSNKPANT